MAQIGMLSPAVRRSAPLSQRLFGPAAGADGPQADLNQSVTDGGGVVQAALSPVAGAGPVGRLPADGLPRISGAASTEPVQINGGPALIIRLNGEIEHVVAARIDDGLISGLYIVRNPDKLSRVERETAMSR
jgi:hypothetical protein